VLRKAENEGIIVDNNEAAEFGLPTEVELVKYLAKLPGAIAKAIETNEPSIVAMYVYKTAELFNKFYKEATIIKEPDAVKRNSRLRLTAAASQVIKNGLYLLGIEAPEKM
jgi:arginyl-tRNA synthetase